jgi:hypothetical protein
MSTRTLNPAPSWGAVARAQLRMLALLQSRDFAILGGLCGVLLLIGLAAFSTLPPTLEEMGEVPPLTPIFPFLALPLGWIAALWPLSVWRREDPSRRGYFWSLPVPRAPHTLLRVAVGWLLLMGVCVAMMTLMIAVSLPLDARYDETRISLAYAWVPLLVPTLPYLFFSVVAVAFENPLRALAWIGAAVFAVVVMVEQEVIASRVSSLTAPVMQSLAIAIVAPVVNPYDEGEIPGRWAPHYLTWLGLGVALVVAAAFRRRDVS